LKVIDNQEARDAVSNFASKEALTSSAGAHAQEIAFELDLEAIEKISVGEAVKLEIFDKSFRNLFELNAAYIHIPGGSFKYSVSKKEESIPDIYFAKYPVTNKRYRRFISYLAGKKEDDLSEILDVKTFCERMLEFAETIDGFSTYLGTDLGKWAEKLNSEHDDDKRFKGDDQPVIGISWFDAQAYCHWLSLLDAISKGIHFDESENKYRLPTELEWEWAASGGQRKYPWGSIEPNNKLANYNVNVGTTTPVGRYPDGDTPECLMDMAGNVWEWMENWYEGYEGRYRSLRGGSWYSSKNDLCCSGRNNNALSRCSLVVGFRVVRSQS
jgi:formylglycine-generating enzyme required for sulfatase activity